MLHRLSAIDKITENTTDFNSAFAIAITAFFKYNNLDIGDCYGTDSAQLTARFACVGTCRIIWALTE